MRVWADASAVTALDAIGEATVLHELLATVTITPEVRTEVFKGRESDVLRRPLGTRIEVVPTPGDRGKLDPDRARSLLRKLVRRGFRLSTDLYDEALAEIDRAASKPRVPPGE